MHPLKGTPIDPLEDLLKGTPIDPLFAAAELQERMALSASFVSLDP